MVERFEERERERDRQTDRQTDIQTERQRQRDRETETETETDRVNEHPQERVGINVEEIRKQFRKIPNWKAPVRGAVRGYWIKNLSSLHKRVSSQMNGILMGEDDLPEWITHGRTVLYQKDPRKVNTTDNYRAITCLPLMWKLNRSDS